MRDEIAAADEFEREKRRALRREARIEQLRNMRMVQPREHLLLAQEAPTLLRGVHIDAQQLQCDGLRTAREFAFGLEHAGHAAGADETKHAIAGDARQSVRRMLDQRRQPAAQAAFKRFETGRVSQRLRDQIAQGHVLAVPAQPVDTLRIGQVEQPVEQRFDLVPASGEFGDHRGMFFVGT